MAAVFGGQTPCGADVAAQRGRDSERERGGREGAEQSKARRRPARVDTAGLGGGATFASRRFLPLRAATTHRGHAAR